MKQPLSAWHCTVSPRKNPEIHYCISLSQKACLYLSIVQLSQSHSLVLRWFLSVRYDCAAVPCVWDRKRKEPYKGQSDVRYTPGPNNGNVPQHVCLDPELYSVKWHSFTGDSVEKKGPLLRCVCNETPMTPWYRVTSRLWEHIYVCRRFSATQRNCHIRWVPHWPAGERLIIDHTWCFDIVAVALEWMDIVFLCVNLSFFPLFF